MPQQTSWEKEFTSRSKQGFPIDGIKNDSKFPMDITLRCFELTWNCFHGDTLIDVCCNESLFPYGKPIKDLVGTSGLLYSFDTLTEFPVVKEFKNVRKTGTQTPLLEVSMEAIRGGQSLLFRRKEKSSILLTANHLVLVRRGFRGLAWIPAGQLNVGDRLFSNQRNRQNEDTSDNIRGEFRHKLISEFKLGRFLLPHPEEVSHHIDGNHKNNEPSNVAVKSQSKHLSDHQNAKYGYEAKLKELDVDYFVGVYNSDPTMSYSQLAEMLGGNTVSLERVLETRKVAKRTQSEILQARYLNKTEKQRKESSSLYKQGYLITEIARYFKVEDSVVSKWLEMENVAINKDGNSSKWGRRKLILPSLNHTVLDVKYAGLADVYDLEVEDTHSLFANEVIVHNCGNTHAPDFGEVTIVYTPDKLVAETKALKIYLTQFRHRDAFNEELCHRILLDFLYYIKPKRIEVRLMQSPRGGIENTSVARWNSEDPDDLAIWQKLQYSPKKSFRGGWNMVKPNA